MAADEVEPLKVKLVKQTVSCDWHPALRQKDNLLPFVLKCPTNFSLSRSARGNHFGGTSFPKRRQTEVCRTARVNIHSVKFISNLARFPHDYAGFEAAV